jgi:uncharacterized protein YlxP (DUF503 family)
MALGVLTLHLHFAGCGSLKEKRRRLKPLLNRLHKEFNISVSEVGYQDVWQDTLIACALISSDHNHTQRSLQKISDWVDRNWLDARLVSDQLEMI